MRNSCGVRVTSHEAIDDTEASYMAWIVPIPPSARHPQARYQVCFQDGKRHRAAGIFPTKRLALAEKRAIERGDRQPFPEPVDLDPQKARMPFGEYVSTKWWPAWKDQHPSSEYGTRKKVEKRILPTFGDIPIGDLDASTVGAWKAAMIAEGLAPRTVNTYLDAMDRLAASYRAIRPAVAPPRVLAALGPKMLALAAERSQGAHTYLAPPEHTATAREKLGHRRWLLPEQGVILETDPGKARTIARRHHPWIIARLHRLVTDAPTRRPLPAPCGHRFVAGSGGCCGWVGRQDGHRTPTSTRTLMTHTQAPSSSARGAPER